jgi:hypothetical protein
VDKRDDDILWEDEKKLRILAVRVMKLVKVKTVRPTGETG